MITDPKTPKSVRVIQMPQFLTDEIRDYLKSLYKVQPDQRISEVTKSYLHHEMDRGAKEAGVKRIRIHDLRHPYVKHTTKNKSLQKQKSQTTKNDDLGFLFLQYCCSWNELLYYACLHGTDGIIRPNSHR